MKKITIILPIHKFDEQYRLMYKNALNSLIEFSNDIKLMIVTKKELKDLIIENSEGNIETEFVINKGKTDFCTQVNLGVNNCKTEWFSIMEVDDRYENVWLKSMNDYITHFPEVSIFLPIVRNINESGDFIGFINESAWAYGFTEEMSYVDNQTLLEYENYQISGGLYKTEIMKKYNFLKDNIKLTFGHELLLRMTYNSVKIKVVPKIGYTHTDFRYDSLFWLYKNDENEKLSLDEVKFWDETAKKEFFFTNKREIEYVTK